MSTFLFRQLGLLATFSNLANDNSFDDFQEKCLLCPIVSLVDSNIKIFEKCRHWKRWSCCQRDGGTLLEEEVHFSFGVSPCLRAALRYNMHDTQRHARNAVALKRYPMRAYRYAPLSLSGKPFTVRHCRRHFAKLSATL